MTGSRYIYKPRPKRAIRLTVSGGGELVLRPEPKGLSWFVRRQAGYAVGAVLGVLMGHALLSLLGWT